MFEISIDTGGTFTDGLLADEKGSINIAKVPTTGDDLSNGIMQCLTKLAEGRGMTLDKLLPEVSTVVTGTAVATNAVLQAKGAKTCMITNKGFRDIIELRRVVKPDLYNLKMPQPTILVPRYLRFVVEETTKFNGTTIKPLNEDQVREAAKKAKAHNMEVVVVAFLHSYINPKPEQRAAEIVREVYPEAEVITSASILPRPMEFERFNTAVVAGFVKPLSEAFMETMDKKLKGAGFKGTLLFTTANAAITTPEVVNENPIVLVGSGPTAGPLMAALVGKSCGCEDIISCDMGGTSLDIGVIPGGRMLTTTDAMVGEQRNAFEITDVASIGGGGGSIAWIDQRGMLKVGPDSAGADPGPACYGKGGTKPTITDADVVLGYIDPDSFLGGEIKLDKAAAEKVIKEEIADPLGLDVLEAADAIRSLADFIMADGIFRTTVFRGYDPKRFTLCLGGGAGPQHGIAVASKLHIKDVYIPKLAPIFCASGMIGASYSHIFARGVGYSGDNVDLDAMNKVYQQLEAQGASLLEREGVAQEAMKVRRGAKIRYYGQVHDCEATMPEAAPGTPVTKDDLDALIKDFHTQHKDIYGFSDVDTPILITTLKINAIGVREPLKMMEQPAAGEDSSAALKGKRSIYTKDGGGLTEMSCYDGDKLQNGNVVAGPALIEEKMTTVVVPADVKVKVDSYGNYIANL